MRKVLFMLLLLLATTRANAQIETMRHLFANGDPMTGQTDRDIWGTEHIGLIRFADGTVNMMVLNPSQIFTPKGNTTKVGLYSKNDSLLILTEHWSARTNDGSTILYLNHGYTNTKEDFGTPIPPETKENKSVTKYVIGRMFHFEKIVYPADILKFLQTTDGYIRVVAQTYGGGVYDARAKMENDDSSRP